MQDILLVKGKIVKSGNRYLLYVRKKYAEMLKKIHGKEVYALIIYSKENKLLALGLLTLLLVSLLTALPTTAFVGTIYSPFYVNANSWYMSEYNVEKDLSSYTYYGGFITALTNALKSIAGNDECTRLYAEVYTALLALWNVTYVFDFQNTTYEELNEFMEVIKAPIPVYGGYTYSSLTYYNIETRQEEPYRIPAPHAIWKTTNLTGVWKNGQLIEVTGWYDSTHNFEFNDPKLVINPAPFYANFEEVYWGLYSYPIVIRFRLLENGVNLTNMKYAIVILVYDTLGTSADINGPGTIKGSYAEYYDENAEYGSAYLHSLGILFEGDLNAFVRCNTVLKKNFEELKNGYYLQKYYADAPMGFYTNRFAFDEENGLVSVFTSTFNNRGWLAVHKIGDILRYTDFILFTPHYVVVAEMTSTMGFGSGEPEVVFKAVIKREALKNFSIVFADVGTPVIPLYFLVLEPAFTEGFAFREPVIEGVKVVLPEKLVGYSNYYVEPVTVTRTITETVTQTKTVTETATTTKTITTTETTTKTIEQTHTKTMKETVTKTKTVTTTTTETYTTTVSKQMWEEPITYTIALIALIAGVLIGRVARK